MDQTEDESVGDLRDKEIRVADISEKVSFKKMRWFRRMMERSKNLACKIIL